MGGMGFGGMMPPQGMDRPPEDFQRPEDGGFGGFPQRPEGGEGFGEFPQMPEGMEPPANMPQMPQGMDRPPR